MADGGVGADVNIDDGLVVCQTSCFGLMVFFLLFLFRTASMEVYKQLVPRTKDLFAVSASTSNRIVIRLGRSDGMIRVGRSAGT